MERFLNSKIVCYILAILIIGFNYLIINNFIATIISSLCIILGELFYLNSQKYKLNWWDNLNENDKHIYLKKYFRDKEIYSLSDREISSIYDREHQ